MKLRSLFALIVAFTLAGATSAFASRQDVLNSWIGATEQRLVDKWGPPDKVYQAPDGSRILTYESSRIVYIEGTPPSQKTTVIDDMRFTDRYPGTPGSAYAVVCKTSFTIVDGRVKSWRQRGNGC